MNNRTSSAERVSTEVAPERCTPSVRELAEAHGISLDRVQDQTDHIDVLTGKRLGNY